MLPTFTIPLQIASVSSFCLHLYFINEPSCSVRVNTWSDPHLHWNSWLWMGTKLWFQASHMEHPYHLAVHHIGFIYSRISLILWQSLALFSSQIDCVVPFPIIKYNRSNRRRINSQSSSISISIVMSQSHASIHPDEVMMDSTCSLSQAAFPGLGSQPIIISRISACIIATLHHITNCYASTGSISAALCKAILYSCQKKRESFTDIRLSSRNCVSSLLPVLIPCSLTVMQPLTLLLDFHLISFI